MDTIVLAIFAILAVFCCIAMGLHIMFETNIGANFQEYLPWERINPDKEWSPTKSGLLVFWSYLILLNTLVPISLYVSVEMIRLGQSLFINWDLGMYYEPRDQAAVARSTTLNEDLGQIKYIFSDKTGTLTQNIMEYIKATIAGTVYAINQDSNDEYDSQLLTDLRNRRDAQSNDLRDFLLCMAVCHTVIPEFDEKTRELKSYNASSPDERAL